jgi:uncharacterized protein (TIGR00251 family)
MVQRPWSQASAGVTLNVRLTPRSNRDAIEGVECLSDGRTVLKVRVRAAPFEGAANDALCRLVAKELGIAARQVEIAGGATARLKRLHIAGEPRMLAPMLERLATRTG